MIISPQFLGQGSIDRFKIDGSHSQVLTVREGSKTDQTGRWIPDKEKTN